jgi:hypothetical protein
METIAQPKYTGLFPEIENLDASILRNLLKIEGITETKPGIAVCTLDLPPGEMFRLNGIQYGVFLVTRKNGELEIAGVRTERHDGRGAYHIALKTLKVALKALGLEEPVVAEFRHRLIEID